MFDAEGHFDEEPCPICGGKDTITYDYREGFSDVECRTCGFRSDLEELSDLQRFSGELLEGDDGSRVPVPIKTLKA